jgi:C-terminal peptidase prc
VASAAPPEAAEEAQTASTTVTTDDGAAAPVPAHASADSPGAVHAANGAAADDSAADDDDDEDDRDYWKNSTFDVHNFNEVLEYVQVHYIDGNPDNKRAWIEAANFALLSLEPAAEVVPASFLDGRKGTPDEEGRLDGKTEPFLCNGVVVPGVVLHRLPDDDYLKAHRKPRKKGRLSNEEVTVLRDKQKARNVAYNDAWKALPWARPQFECAMTQVAQDIKAWRATQKAAKAEAKVEAKVDVKAEPKVEAKSDAKDKPKATDKSVASKDSASKDSASKELARKRRPPDLNRAWVAAANGYLYALDPHSSVIPRKAWDESTDKTQDASFEGIGAILSQREDMTIVENPMEGKPAWRAGIRAGDTIMKVDGNDVSGLSLTKVVGMIRGKRNTKVVLTISRESEPEPRDFAIVREHIDVKNVDGELVKEYAGVAHVKMTGFVPRSTADLRDMIDKLERQAPGGKLTGLVLDFRGNSGGLLNQAIEVADLFLPAGKRIVSVKSRRKPEEVTSARTTSGDYSFPVVVLVNDGSASASEIVTSALQDNGRGLVVGLRTFGKASVQTLFEPALHLDYYIKLTVARYYAPGGQTIQVVGVHPDVQVAPDVDGKIPVGFREENLNNHLVPIESKSRSPWVTQLPTLDQCVAESGQADKLAKREPKPQIHPDYQLLKAADYVVCLGRQAQATTR